MQNLIATTSEVVHYIALQAVHYKPLQEVHLSRYNQLTAEYERMTKLTYHQVRYLGEWHSHPNMPNTPSVTDKKQFKELWEEQQSQDLPFVQIIYGNNGLYVTAAM